MEKINHIEFLDLVARGCTSGRFSEWQQLRPACQWAIDKISEASNLYVDECVRNTELNTEIAELREDKAYLLGVVRRAGLTLSLKKKRKHDG